MVCGVHGHGVDVSYSAVGARCAYLHRAAAYVAPGCRFARERDEFFVRDLGGGAVVPELEHAHPLAPDDAVAHFLAHAVDFVLCEFRGCGLDGHAYASVPVPEFEFRVFGRDCDGEGVGGCDYCGVHGGREPLDHIWCRSEFHAGGVERPRGRAEFDVHLNKRVENILAV